MLFWAEVPQAVLLQRPGMCLSTMQPFQHVQGINGFATLLRRPVTSPDVKRLIRSMVERDPKRRIKMEGICQQPWVAQAGFPITSSVPFICHNRHTQCLDRGCLEVLNQISRIAQLQVSNLAHHGSRAHRDHHLAPHLKA